MEAGKRQSHSRVHRNVKVERGGALADATRGIVVRSVARAEVAAVLARVCNGDTAQMGANAEDDQPGRVLHNKVDSSK